MYPYYYNYRQNNWEPILTLLQQSLYAEEMVCSMSSELYHIPQTKDLEGNNEMHNHLVPASYHRVTTVGCAIRLVNGERRQSIIDTLAACIVNAQKQDRGVRQWLGVMEQNASSEFKNFIQMIIRWQTQAESTMQRAKEAVRTMGVNFPEEGEGAAPY
ncbi:hypothetical protein SAMN05877753_102589 [Bacillus oleivorans]|uniref:Uncharacterized protein n=1 Tax=Bacillus oleivorans TaxID=1448271 RepID=A0A285CLY1_9BACI|nr:hypothetical protein [Bacillus oleivorans]SNX68551.1 hypothetical protein SAMN05877753_102589 [Bacillus oleivorans]